MTFKESLVFIALCLSPLIFIFILDMKPKEEIFKATTKCEVAGGVYLVNEEKCLAVKEIK